jgi:hypothetical protein
VTDAPRPMWDGQRAFRHLAEADARELLRELDERLRPTVILVGIHWDDAGEGPAVLVEPADEEGLSARLAGVRARARTAPHVDRPTRGIADPRLAMGTTKEAPRLALLETLQDALASHDEATGRASFCSLPQPVGAYMVAIVVQLDARARAAHGLGAAGDRARSDEPFRSLLEAAIDEFLVECSLALTHPEMGRYGVTSHEVPDLLRAAGKKLMHGPGRRMHGMLDLYDICTTISTMRYEGGDSVGGLLVAPRHGVGVQVGLALRHPVSLRAYRTVRKLLEISGGDAMLLCADGEIYGLGALDPSADAGDRHYRIAFTGHHRWRLALGPRVLMEVSYGQPRLPKERIDPAAFRRLVESTFPGIDRGAAERLWALVVEAAQQRHGTMVVVSAGAEAEAARLGHQGISIEPVSLSPELMRLVTAIDGAVLIDPTNRCHAIGTILDGRASSFGDPSRGARYNSALRYVASSETACLAIVVSEDGMIDLVSSS